MSLTRFTPAFALLLAAAAAAHDWNSPAPPGAPPWSGRLWAGPAQGAPPAPSATDCHRAPRQTELPGPVAPQQLSALEDRAAAKSTLAGPARLSRERADTAMAPAAPLQPAETAPAAAEPVTAGVVDDNADFGAYLDFRDRHAGLTVRDLDVSERYLLTVHDAAGRPVPDAEVSCARRSRRAAVGPHRRRRAGLAASARRRADAARARGAGAQAAGDGTQRPALLQRGQRDALQVHAGRRPAQRTRAPGPRVPGRRHRLDGRRDRQAAPVDAGHGRPDRRAAEPAVDLLRSGRLPRPRRRVLRARARLHRRPRRLPARPGRRCSRWRRRHAPRR